MKSWEEIVYTESMKLSGDIFKSLVELRRWDTGKMDQSAKDISYQARQITNEISTSIQKAM